MNEETKCPQCGKSIPKNEGRMYQIISRSLSNKLVVEDLRFCDEQCGFEYQMGCEG